MGRLYRVQEFAELAGVTVKALHHYDRIGLLRPGRSEGGYRVYTERDLERLEQILALKFLGLPLRQIQAVLNRPALELRQALLLQRAALEEKQRIVSRAIRAIQTAEAALASGQPADPALLKPIIEAIDMRESIEAMKKYYSEEAWLKRKEHYERWPSPEFESLFREIGAALGGDPAGEKAEEFKARLRELVNRSATGDPEVQAGAIAAWKDRENWPASLREKARELQMEKVVEFLARATAASWRKYIASEEWARLDDRMRNPTEPWNDWFLRVRAALEEEPPGEKAQDFVTRMMEL